MLVLGFLVFLSCYSAMKSFIDREFGLVFSLSGDAAVLTSSKKPTYAPRTINKSDPSRLKDTFMQFSADQNIEQLVPYSVGLLKEVQAGNGTIKYVPAGSGVLVEIAGIKGILTAAHVLEGIQKSENAILFTVTNRQTKARPLRFSTAQLEAIAIRGEGEEFEGPDIAFIRIPLEIAGDLNSKNSFCNFAVRNELAKNRDQHPNYIHEMVVGVVAENTKLKSRGNGMRTDTHALSLAYGMSSGIKEMEVDYDTFEFKVSHNENMKRPESYGGLSGSPIWRIADSGNAKDHAIYGIVFYESEATKTGERTLICNGPSTIYRQLADALATKIVT